MEEISYTPEWDRANQRFTTPSRCPYPDCTAPVAPLHADEPTLSWCAVCQRPFEVVPFRPAPGEPPLDLLHRPGSAYCTYTGQLLTAYSVLDWSEAGGEPGRNYCLDDARGAVFGRPSSRRIVRFEEDWAQHSILTARGDDDFVSSVSVVRGRVVAVTARGWIGLFDATSGEPIERPLDWPTGSPNPEDPAKAVRCPPAFRGTQMVIVAPHEAQFRDLKHFLFSSRGNTARQHQMVIPGEGRQFLSPPLGVDGLGRPTFCLLEGRENAATETIEEASLRFFDETGEEVGRCTSPDIARSPVFDRRLGCVVWVDGQGRLWSLTVSQISEKKLQPTISDLPDRILKVDVNLRPTFAVAPNSQGRSEVWLSTTLPQGGVELHRTLLDDALRRRVTSWRWQTQTLSGIGEVTGLAVGSGSTHANNATSQLLAVATDRQVLSLNRANVAGSGRAAMRGPESAGMPGSYDVPLLCSAGVVARLRGSIRLDCQGLGWSDESYQPKVPVPGLYQRAQGMAMFGRRVYIGQGMGVRSYRIDVKELEET